MWPLIRASLLPSDGSKVFLGAVRPRLKLHRQNARQLLLSRGAHACHVQNLQWVISCLR